MRIIPRSDGLTMLLLAVLLLAGVGSGQQDAAVRTPPALERLMALRAGDQIAGIATRESGWQDPFDRRDRPLPRTLWPSVAGVSIVLLLRFAVVWWLVWSPPQLGFLDRTRVVAGPRAPPRSV